MRKLIRKRRQRRVQKLNRIIAARTLFLDGVSEAMWTFEYRIASRERQRAALERQKLLAKLDQTA
jgi:hypothetical protein